MTYRDPSPAESDSADAWIRRVNAVGLVLGYDSRFGDQPAPPELEQLADLVPVLQAKLVDDKWKSKHATLVAKAEAKALEKALLHVDDTVHDPASAKSVLLSLEILHTDWANHALDAESAKITTAENDLMQWARVSLDSVNQRKAETARQVLKSDWAQSHLNEADKAKMAELEVCVFSRLLTPWLMQIRWAHSCVSALHFPCPGDADGGRLQPSLDAWGHAPRNASQDASRAAL